MKYEIHRQAYLRTSEEQNRFATLARNVYSTGGLTIPRSFLFNVMAEKAEVASAFIMVFDDFVTVDYLYVEPNSRRQAVGRALLEEIVGYAKSLGVSRLTTSTIGAHGSVDFWKKCGFQILATSTGQDPAHDIYYLERRF